MNTELLKIEVQSKLDVINIIQQQITQGLLKIVDDLNNENKALKTELETLKKED